MALPGVESDIWEWLHFWSQNGSSFVLFVAHNMTDVRHIVENNAALAMEDRHYACCLIPLGAKVNWF